MKVFPYLSEIIACFMFSSVPVILKSVDISFLYKIVISILSVFIPAFSVFLYYKKKKNIDFKFSSLLTNNRQRQIGLLFSIYYYCLYYGFIIIPVSIAIPIFMLSPIMMALLDNIIYGTILNNGQIGSFIIAFIGVLLVVVSKTKINNENIYFGSLLIFISAAIYAYVYTQIKHTIPEDIEKYQFDTINFEMLETLTIPLIVSVFILIVFNLVNINYSHIIPKKLQPILPNFKDIIFMVSVLFILSYVGNLMYLYSYNNLPLTTYGALENMEVIASLVIGYYFLSEDITKQKIIGCLTIISGILLELYFRQQNVKQIKSDS